jgi:hypothetical protein
VTQRHDDISNIDRHQSLTIAGKATLSDSHAFHFEYDVFGSKDILGAEKFWAER